MQLGISAQLVGNSHTVAVARLLVVVILKVASITLTSKWVEVHQLPTLTTGVLSQITSSIPATGTVRQRTIVATAATIGRLLPAIMAALTA